MTLKNCYGIKPPSYVSTAYVVASYGPRFLSTLRFVKIWATRENFWANGLPPPLAKNFPYAYGEVGVEFASKGRVPYLLSLNRNIILWTNTEPSLIMAFFVF